MMISSFDIILETDHKIASFQQLASLLSWANVLAPPCPETRVGKELAYQSIVVSACEIIVWGWISLTTVHRSMA